MQLPIFPAGVTEINNRIGVQTVERALFVAARMAGTERSRGDCLELVCAALDLRNEIPPGEVPKAERSAAECEEKARRFSPRRLAASALHKRGALGRESAYGVRPPLLYSMTIPRLVGPKDCW